MKKSTYDTSIIMNTREAIAWRTRELLEEKQMTQYRLEQNAGISHNTMNSLMNGKHSNVNFKTVVLIILGLGTDLWHFFDSPVFDVTKFEID